MRLSWLTDIHLDFLKDPDIRRFCRTVNASLPDAVLIGGDIAVATSLEKTLCILEQEFVRPVFFVLGNHDFYHGSIESVRALVRSFTQNSANLRWLPACGIVRLTEKTCLIGHDGWADSRLGDYDRSPVELNDYYLIEEFKGLHKDLRPAVMKSLADEATNYLNLKLHEALVTFTHVLIMTHVPPFRQACWHEGQISNDEYLPHFACQATGEALVRAMKAHPQNDLTVLCGHTHSRGETRILPNLTVKTGAAVYGNPQLQEVFSAE